LRQPLRELITGEVRNTERVSAYLILYRILKKIVAQYGAFFHLTNEILSFNWGRCGTKLSPQPGGLVTVSEYVRE
jgi:hypothetical protein